VPLHQLIQFALARVTERRMSDVMHQCQRFHQLRIQPERRRHRSRNLRHLERVRQPITKMIRKAHRENLRLRFQPPKRARMHDPVAIARIFASIFMGSFGKAPASRLIRVHGPRRESGKTIDASLRFLTARKTKNVGDELKKTLSFRAQREIRFFFSHAALKIQDHQLRLRPQRIQSAIRFFRNRRLRIFLLHLLIHGRRFLRIALPQHARELQ
jgi:hypothetical protein